jgi:hypothetical protein
MFDMPWLPHHPDKKVFIKITGLPFGLKRAF